MLSEVGLLISTGQHKNVIGTEMSIDSNNLLYSLRQTLRNALLNLRTARAHRLRLLTTLDVYKRQVQMCCIRVLLIRVKIFSKWPF